MAGICAFTSDAKVEYFLEEIPQSYREEGEDQFGLPSASAALSLWAPKWVYASEVNLLLQDEMVVRYNGFPVQNKLIKQSNFEFLKGCPTARGRRRAACLESSRNGLTLFSTRSGRTTLCARYDKFPTKNNQTFATTRAATATCRSMT